MSLGARGFNHAWRQRRSPRMPKGIAMANFLGLMKQAAELKTKMEAMQAELDQIEVEGSSGGNLVTVKINAKGELKAVSIDPSLMKHSQ